jgi:hypothetical protein
MKALTLIILMIMLPAASALDFSEYPAFFAKHGWDMQMDFVVGEKAPSTDVLAGADLAPQITQWVNEANQERPVNNQIEWNPRGISKTDASKDINDNYIAIGRPCDNKKVAELLNTTRCDDFKEGEGYIEIFETEKGVALIITGGDSEGITKAKNVIYNKDAYSFSHAYYYIRDDSPYTLYPTKFKPKTHGTTEEKNQTANETNKTTETVQCTGCEFEGDCIQTGQIRKNEYCSTENTMKPQVADGSNCGTNYQCINGTCDKNTCGKTQDTSLGTNKPQSNNVFVRIIRWFAHLFG